MRIRIVDEELDDDYELCLMAEGWGWADRDCHEGACRIPAKEDFLARDLTEPAEDAPLEERLAYEGVVLRRAAFFQYVYRRRIYERRPELFHKATNVLNAEQTLMRYGAVLALGNLPLEDSIPVQDIDTDCPQHRIMMDSIREGYQTQRQEEAAAASEMA